MLLYGFKDLKNCPQVTWITVILEWREQIKTVVRVEWINLVILVWDQHMGHLYMVWGLHLSLPLSYHRYARYFKVTWWPLLSDLGYPQLICDTKEKCALKSPLGKIWVNWSVRWKTVDPCTNFYTDGWEVC